MTNTPEYIVDLIEDIFERCETLSKLNNKFFNTQFEELKHKSPTSLKISLKQQYQIIRFHQLLIIFCYLNS